MAATWGSVLAELQATNPGGPPDFDLVRRRYLIRSHQITGRAVILYASGWCQKNNADPSSVSIAPADMSVFMETVHGVGNIGLDLVLHSPGGSFESAEAIVSYLRSKFTDIRVVVPQYAMSAACMISCAADRILMGKHSFLGPIDPQIVLQTQLGIRMVPAQAVLQQFEDAKSECSDPRNLSAWLPMLSQFGPELLVRCKYASELSEKLVAKWLCEFMFHNDANKIEKSKQIANWLASHSSHSSHGRHLDRTLLENAGMKIEHLENDQELQDAYLGLLHATTHTFSGTGAVKLIENHMGKAYVIVGQQVQFVPAGK